MIYKSIEGNEIDAMCTESYYSNPMHKHNAEIDLQKAIGKLLMNYLCRNKGKHFCIKYEQQEFGPGELFTLGNPDSNTIRGTIKIIEVIKEDGKE